MITKAKLKSHPICIGNLVELKLELPNNELIVRQQDRELSKLRAGDVIRLIIMQTKVVV